MSLPLSGRPAELHSAIELFLQERRDGKLEKLAADDIKRDALLAQFEFTTWIGDAARRVGQIQAVTHALKATHPDARGTSLYCLPATLPQHKVMGSHSLGASFSGDVVGNAAALDVHKFLKIEHNGRTLLDLMLADDADLRAALSDDDTQSRTWMQAFAGIVQPRDGPASHAQAKQLYWLVGDEPRDDASYHLLAPVYASSLAHKVFQTINEDRFGESAKIARQAKRDAAYSELGFHEYPHLAVQKLGGTKPQNISQLNSERGGNNYLLASLPPLWKSDDMREPLNMESVFPAFGKRREVWRLVHDLRNFLASDPGETMDTRNDRDDWTDRIIDELLHFASLVQKTLEPGWSALPDCRLPRTQQLWLDPDRALADEDFAAEWKAMNWPQDIYERFANWLNGQLKTDKLLMGDPEHRHLAREMKGEQEFLWQIDQQKRRLKKLEALKEELNDDQ